MALAPLPTATYADRNAHIRYADRYAKVGDRLRVELLDGTTRDAVVTAVTAGTFVTTVLIDIAASEDGDHPAFTTELSSDWFNNLTNANIGKVELYR